MRGHMWTFRGTQRHLLHIINEKIIVFIKDNVMSGQISTLIISTAHLL